VPAEMKLAITLRYLATGEKEISSKVTDDNEDTITIEEFNKVLKQAKNRKSCGLDNLPMELRKFGRN
jgi:hypothetical protein